MPLSTKTSMMRSLTGRPDVTRLAENFFMITGPNGSRFPFCNAFLIADAENVLIDTGIGNNRLKEIDAVCRIDRVIISHPHPDHISGYEVVKDRPLMIPRETPESIHDLVELGTRFTGTAELGRYWARFARLIGVVPLEAPESRFGHGDILNFGSVRLEAIHVPGHITDHYCFFEHNSRTLLTTDIDFSAFGPWYGNPESQIRPFRDGIEKITGIACDRVCSSHKPPMEGDAADAFREYLDGFERHRNLVLALCDPPKTVAEMIAASPFYNDKMPDKTIQNLFERMMIEKNLELLIEEGQVGMKDGKYYRIK